jgi:hypothetical protein
MASKTKRTELIRKRKVTSHGRVRKNSVNKNGTTQSAAALFGDEVPAAE